MAPLSVALQAIGVIHAFGLEYAAIDSKGWYNSVGLWRPFTPLKPQAEPFIPYATYDNEPYSQYEQSLTEPCPKANAVPMTDADVHLEPKVAADREPEAAAVSDVALSDDSRGGRTFLEPEVAAKRGSEAAAVSYVAPGGGTARGADVAAMSNCLLSWDDLLQTGQACKICLTGTESLMRRHMGIAGTLPDDLEEDEFLEDEEEEEDVERDEEVPAHDDQEDDGHVQVKESEAASPDALATSVNVADVPKVPKAPMSAYLTFVHNKRPTMQGSVTEVAASLRKLWTEMDPIEKQALEEKAKAEIEQYHSEPLLIIQGKSSKYKGDFNLQLHEQRQSTFARKEAIYSARMRNAGKSNSCDEVCL